MFTSTPETLSAALLARKDELRDVDLHHYVSPFLWATPEAARAFKLVRLFATPADRKQVHTGSADYPPFGNFRHWAAKDAIRTMDISIINTSPPDENGSMSLGTALRANRPVLDISTKIVCEVDEPLIRTNGENFVHISDVECLAEHRTGDDREPPIPV